MLLPYCLFFHEIEPKSKNVFCSKNTISQYSSPQHFWTSVSVFVPWKTVFFVAETDSHFIFSKNKKFICRKKCCFRECYIFLLSPPHPKIFVLNSRVPYLSNQNLLSFHFFWSEIKNSRAEKSAVFAEIHDM
jgi:hypothetical protein